MDEIFELRVTFYGLVQGVFFRAAVKDVADALNLKGFVKNQADGTVFAKVIGDSDKLKEFMKKIGQNPGSGRIDKIDYKIVKSTEKVENFQINY